MTEKDETETGVKRRTSPKNIKTNEKVITLLSTTKKCALLCLCRQQ